MWLTFCFARFLHNKRGVRDDSGAYFTLGSGMLISARASGKSVDGMGTSGIFCLTPLLSSFHIHHSRGSTPTLCVIVCGIVVAGLLCVYAGLCCVAPFPLPFTYRRVLSCCRWRRRAAFPPHVLLLCPIKSIPVPAGCMGVESGVGDGDAFPRSEDQRERKVLVSFS